MSLESGYIPKLSCSVQRMEDGAGAGEVGRGWGSVCVLCSHKTSAVLPGGGSESDLEMHSESDGTTRRAPNQQALNN